MAQPPPFSHLVFNKYKFCRLIAEGGIGAVFLAQDASGREAAIKCIRPSIRENANGVIPADLEPGLRREAQIQSAFGYKGIVNLLESGCDEVLGFCFIMEYVPGGTLRRHIGGKSLEPGEFLWITDEILGTLEVIHAPTLTHPFGVVHRDVTPRNILLTEDGFPKLSDFHMARVVVGGTAPDDPDSTGIDHIINTRTDLYLLGRTFYEMATGIVADNMDASRLSAPYRSFLRKLVDPDIRGRYPSAGLARQDLRRLGEAKRPAML